MRYRERPTYQLLKARARAHGRRAEAIDREIQRRREHPMTDRQRFILTTVANTYSMPEEDVLSRLRSKHTTLVRQICYWMMRKIMFMYVADIACAMKRRDHSCVCAGLKAVEKKRGMDVDFAKLLQYLETTIRRQLTPLDPAIAEKLCGELLCYA